MHTAASPALTAKVQVMVTCNKGCCVIHGDSALAGDVDECGSVERRLAYMCEWIARQQT